MKTKFVLLAMAMGIWLPITGQILSSTVVAPGGGTGQHASMIIEWTFGEIAVESIRSGDHLYTEGFHQPVLTITPLPQAFVPMSHAPEITGEGLVRVVPNPVSSLLTIEFEFPDELAFDIRVHDLQGRLMKTDQLVTRQGSLRMDFSSFPSGLYVLHVQSADGHFARSCKVSKI